MGSCIVRPLRTRNDSSGYDDILTPLGESMSSSSSSLLIPSSPSHRDNESGEFDSYVEDPTMPCPVDQDKLNKWIDEALKVFLDKVDVIYSKSYLPYQLRRLENLSRLDEGWLRVAYGMITNVNSKSRDLFVSNNYAGPTFMVLMLEGAQLPTKDIIERLVQKVDPIFAMKVRNPVDDITLIMQRNACVIYGFIAERMAGPFSVLLMTPALATFLVHTLQENLNPSLTLYVLLCLESMAMTRENKEFLTKNFDISKVLMELEENLLGGNSFDKSVMYNCTPKEMINFQVGFLAQWLLDNVFIKKGRKLSYKQVDYSNLSMILDHKDKSDYCKLSPNGLSVRCDTCSFECSRGTHAVCSGVYYYEAILVTDGIMQIGWATKDANFSIDLGEGVGDDCNSVAIDGCRRFIWHDSVSYRHSLPGWKVGDVVGCLVDFNEKEFVFYLNGQEAKLARLKKLNYHFASKYFCPAISMMTFQQCYFNFGQLPFKYPPKNYKVKNLNDYVAKFVDKKSIRVIPTHVTNQSTRTRSLSFKSMSLKRNVCSICCDRTANARIKPCDHESICTKCIEQLKDRVCPFCRNTFTSFQAL